MVNHLHILMDISWNAAGHGRDIHFQQQIQFLVPASFIISLGVCALVINCFSLCQFIRSLLRFFYSSLLRFFQAYPLCCVFESPLSREQPGNLLWLCLERGGFCYLCYSICFIVSDEMSPGDTQMKLQGEKTGRKGQLAVATEVSNSSFLKGW